MKVLLDLEHLTDSDVDRLWAAHRALKAQAESPPPPDDDDGGKTLEEPITKERVRELMLEVNKKCGMKAPLGIVAKFGVTKVSELAEKDFPAVVRECNALLGN